MGEYALGQEYALSIGYGCKKADGSYGTDKYRVWGCVGLEKAHEGRRREGIGWLNGWGFGFGGEGGRERGLMGMGLVKAWDGLGMGWAWNVDLAFGIGSRKEGGSREDNGEDLEERP